MCDKFRPLPYNSLGQRERERERESPRSRTNSYTSLPRHPFLSLPPDYCETEHPKISNTRLLENTALWFNNYVYTISSRKILLSYSPVWSFIWTFTFHSRRINFLWITFVNKNVVTTSKLFFFSTNLNIETSISPFRFSNFGSVYMHFYHLVLCMLEHHVPCLSCDIVTAKNCNELFAVLGP